ncbi:ATP-grasp fold amidoligase family protein [Salinivibrio sp. SS2]|uniref:ATP-grasp fold amidoligase family protein n=1 Tax=Salinivibrio sp. SS2 TaxID=1892894 RepID=UPI000A60306B|nr:ATP-grasp fold amidoligase family protein [Salinivibrio sp. DV]
MVKIGKLLDNMRIKKIVARIVPETVVTLIKRCKYRINRDRDFYKNHGYPLNLKDPKSFNEKLYYRKYYGNFDNMALFADKYKVRDYVEKKVGSKYLIPLLGLYEEFTQEDWRALPNKFVLKTNHGSGARHIHIVTNKESENVSDIVKKFRKALKESFGIIKQEPFYARIDRKVIAEKYLESEGKTPNDYKFHCFGEKIFIQVDSDRYDNHKRSFFDADWNRLNIRLDSKFPEIEECLPPSNLKEMIEVATKLSSDFDYVRVDLYNVNGRVYFGELTLTHGNGTEDFKPGHIDMEWGSYWQLDKKNRLLYKN